MDITVPLVAERPGKERSPGDEMLVGPTVDYFLGLLLRHAPAELNAELSLDGKVAGWSITSLPGKTLIHNENIPSILFRPCLARLAWGYMGGNVYGGFCRARLYLDGSLYSAVFYLGNDGACGFWTKVRSTGKIG